MFPFTALLAVLGDRLFVYPSVLARRIGHPVEWLGGIIGDFKIFKPIIQNGGRFTMNFQFGQWSGSAL